MRCLFDFDSENVVKATFYCNLEPRMKIINKPIDITTCSSSRDIVNICYNNNHVVCIHEETLMERERNITYLSKGFGEVLVPGEWCLLETIEYFVESKNLSIKTDARWGYHPDFFNKIFIPEC